MDDVSIDPTNPGPPRAQQNTAQSPPARIMVAKA
jgi:hypothetical protein